MATEKMDGKFGFQLVAVKERGCDGGHAFPKNSFAIAVRVTKRQFQSNPGHLCTVEAPASIVTLSIFNRP